MQRFFILDCADALADLSLRWAHLSESMFSHIAAPIIGLVIVAYYCFVIVIRVKPVHLLEKVS